MARRAHIPCHGVAAPHRVHVSATASGCLSSTPPDTTPPPAAIAPAVLPPGDTGTATYLLARWKCDYLACALMLAAWCRAPCCPDRLLLGYARPCYHLGACHAGCGAVHARAALMASRVPLTGCLRLPALSFCDTLVRWLAGCRQLACGLCGTPAQMLPAGLAYFGTPFSKATRLRQ